MKAILIITFIYLISILNVTQTQPYYTEFDSLDVTINEYFPGTASLQSAPAVDDSATFDDMIELYYDDVSGCYVYRTARRIYRV